MYLLVEINQHFQSRVLYVTVCGKNKRLPGRGVVFSSRSPSPELTQRFKQRYVIGTHKVLIEKITQFSPLK